MSETRSDEQARRQYWTGTFDKAWEFMQELYRVPLEECGEEVVSLEAAARAVGVPLRVARLGGVFTPFFGGGAGRNLAEIKTCDTQQYAAFFRGLLARGFYLPPSQFEVGFISAAHTPAMIAAFIDAARAAFAGPATPPDDRPA